MHITYDDETNDFRIVFDHVDTQVRVFLTVENPFVLSIREAVLLAIKGCLTRKMRMLVTCALLQLVNWLYDPAEHGFEAVSFRKSANDLLANLPTSDGQR